MSVSHDDTPTHLFQAVHIVYIIPNVDDVLRTIRLFAEIGAQNGPLICNPLQARDLQLCAACLYYVIYFARQDQHGDARPYKALKSQAVAAVAKDRLPSVAHHEHPVVCQHSVKVKNNQRRSRWQRRSSSNPDRFAKDPVDKYQILWIVHLERTPVIHRIDDDAAAKSIGELPQDPRLKDVDRPILSELFGMVLPSMSHSIIVI